MLSIVKWFVYTPVSIILDIDKDLVEVLAQVTFFEVHVSIMLLAYSAFTISFIASLMYILLSREIHNKKLGFFLFPLTFS